MIQNLYSIWDQKAETFMAPFCVPTKGLAIRAFEDAINSDSHHFGQHPADYTLFQTGTFETDTGFIESTKISIGNGVEFVNPELKNTPGAPNGQNRPSIQPDQNG